VELRDIMSRNVVSISPDDSLRTASEIMEFGGVRHLPVVRGGELIGVVSERDLLKASLSNIIGVPADERSYFLEGVTIAEVMSTPAVSASLLDSVQSVAALMAERKIGCVPVLDGGKVVGLVTETDVLRYFARAEGTA